MFSSRRIYLRDLPAHVADMANDSGYKFSEEYEVVHDNKYSSLFSEMLSFKKLSWLTIIWFFHIAGFRGWTGPAKGGLING